MPRILFYWLPRIIFVIIALILILTAKGWQFDIEDRRILKTGIIDVNTLPKGATVFLGSEEAGLTPLKIDRLEPGRYQITLSKEGYHTWQKMLTVHAELATQVSDIVLFPINPITQRINLDSYDRIISLNKNQYLVTLLASADHLSTEISLWTGNFSPIHASSVPIDPKHIEDISITISSDFSTLLVSISEEPPLITAAFAIDITQNNSIPTDLSDLEEYPLLAKALVRPVFEPRSHNLLYNKDLHSIYSLNIATRENKEILTTTNPIVPLAYQAANNFFGQSQLYILDTTSSLEHQISRVQMTSLQVVPLLEKPLPTDPMKILFSDDFSSLYILYEDQHRIISNLDAPITTESIFPDQPKHLFGWNNNASRFLYQNEDNELKYFDLTRQRFLTPYEFGEPILSACWSESSKYIFLLSKDESKQLHRIQVLEDDGKNLTTLITDAQGLSRGKESFDSQVALTCLGSQTLRFGSTSERKNAPPLRSYYEMQL